MANSVNITGSDFSQLNNALDQVAKRSAQSVRFMSRLFNTDYSNGKTLGSLDKLCNKLKETNLEALALNNTLRDVGSAGIRTPSATKSASNVRKIVETDAIASAMSPKDSLLASVLKTARKSKGIVGKVMQDQLASQRTIDVPELSLYGKASAYAGKISKKAAADAKRIEKLKGQEGSDLFVGPLGPTSSQKKAASDAIKFANKIDVPELSLSGKLQVYVDKISKKVAKNEKDIEKLKGKEGSDLFVGPLSASSAQKRDIKNAEKALIDDERARIAEKLKLEREIRQLDKQTAKDSSQEAKKAQVQAAMMRANQAQGMAFDKKIRALQAGEMGGLSATRNAIRRAEAAAAATKSRLGLNGMGLLGPMIKGQMFNFMNERALERAFGFKSRIAAYGSNAGSMVSKFGNPGQMPLFSRFRVFQRPFPGSERNPFSLGDTGNIANNAIYGISSGIRKAFETITTAGTDVVRAFSGVAQAGISVGAKILSALSGIPFVGAIFGAFGTVLASLGQIVGVVTDAFTGLLDGLSKVIGETITAMGTLALGLAGFAHRAVVAASTLTELKNAAAIYVGASGAKAMTATAVEYQQNYGLSASDSLKLMTRFAGQIRQTTGVGSDQAAKEAQAIFKAAADAGSVLNMDLADIGNIAQSAMAGRYTPLRRMGVTVSADYLDTVAKQQGFDKDAKTPFAARTKALEYEILRQTKGFTGDLAATQYEFANQQRKLLGLFEAAFVHVGRALEPFARVIMIASTTVGSIFVKQLEAFGDWIQNSFQDMVDFKDGGKLQVYLAAVTKAAARAADYLLYFADKLYENKDAIYDFVKQVGEVLYSVALDLMRFSLTMISALANAFKMLPNLFNALKAFGEMLDLFARMLDAKLGLGMNDDARVKALKNEGNIEDDEARNLRDRQALRNGKREGWWQPNLNPLGREIIERDIAAREKKIAAAKARKAKVDALMAGGMNQKDAEEKVFGNEPMPWADNMAAGLDRMAQKGKKALDALEQQGLNGVLPNVPGRVNPEDIIDWMLMAPGARPDFGDPEPFKGKGGRLSQYFDPASYRDEVQSREMTAAQQTAENTGIMVEELKNMNAARGAARPGIGMPALTVV